MLEPHPQEYTLPLNGRHKQRVYVLRCIRESHCPKHTRISLARGPAMISWDPYTRSNHCLSFRRAADSRCGQGHSSYWMTLSSVVDS
ncbi:hypothetical protein BV22DRAFT_1040684 [Leucogyrophana mollusca]|uniref:Uncharacterized protein n=2 Tax=Leucogyrophana mollusca TaxID=85980 RepID=A0ACB8B278_9AGAM|nr:hypothetical protein BV22DRAFT_1040892 [Leucogyrophana mollusca]KAH7919640.1 hypothetical protein BV22DRAFT_1040684 [Leucogyrophana mollusca]